MIIALIWISSILLLGPICYLIYVHMSGDVEPVALAKSAMAAVTIAFFLTPMRLPRDATTIAMIWIGSILFLGPFYYVIFVYVIDDVARFALVKSVMISITMAIVATGMRWREKP